MMTETIKQRHGIIGSINHNHSKNNTCVRRTFECWVFAEGNAIRQLSAMVLHNERQSTSCG